MTDNKRVYLFEEGNAAMRDLLGGKGANLAEMTNIGLPVPPGFTVTTEVCIDYIKRGKTMPPGLMDEVKAALAKVEEKMGRKLGDPSKPLLVSVRSGAKFSMPGMMDTILNLGLNKATIDGITKETGNPRFVWDAYRRFVMMFSDVAMDIPKGKFEHKFSALKQKLGAKQDTDVNAADLRKLVEEEFLPLVKAELGRDFPSDPMEQLELAIRAVFDSWDNPRAMVYRNKEKISHDLGTAVNVQTMVFGNMGEDSGTGVAFTRNPATGEKKLFGEYLMNAQGEDVVAGVRTPVDIQELANQNPEIYKQFADIAGSLECHYREMQDIEFTIEHGKLFILQCRSGKRTGMAAVKIAVDMVKEGLITKEEAMKGRVSPEQIEQTMHPRFKSKPADRVIAKGMNAGPGAAVGQIVLDSETAVENNEKHPGVPMILVREETNPDDLAGMLASKGVLTSRGGRTSHAALVARQYGIPTICGCAEIKIDHNKRTVNANGTMLKEGDWISIDGGDGNVYIGELETEPPTESGEVGEIMRWADGLRKLGVRANADTPEQAAEAVQLGAEGIGLCRTEHMFLGDRVPLVQKMILAENEEERQAALDALLPLQREDFVGIFKAMEGRPVTVRLIDPPLHEFLPSEGELVEKVTEIRTRLKYGCYDDPENPEYKSLRAELPDLEKMLSAVRQMHEANPMLGLRGCRLSVYMPGIVQMQVAAIIGAACQVQRSGMDVHPEIMIPLVGHVNELTWIKERLERTARDTMTVECHDIDYSFGTMIEIPRAALTADEIAKEASFFSFGTNDLTQMTYGISRDDAGKFMRLYIDEKILPGDPTESIDRKGVGKLMKMCVEAAREVNPGIKLGICGEHGGDPNSIEFCHQIGLNYVSCSPKRVPIARYAAAQANIELKGAAERDK
ncbi:MAG: pyruvate, phosphate dikinase [Armatimonadota bacterium]|nr:pyruvate, phosphate dikinase [Armatimonadota bacterium]